MNQSNIEAGTFVGIEVSNSCMNAVRVNESGAVLNSFKKPISDGQEHFAALVEFVAEIKAKFGDFDKVGIAVPGLINRQNKLVAFSTFIPEHENQDFFARLESETGLKVSLENDANAAAYGEFAVGAGRGSQSLFYATLGTGVGGALIFNGEIWHGTSGYAGEFGHIVIRSDGRKLEEVASSANIVERTKSRFHQDDTSVLSRIGESEITLADIVAAAKNEDDLAQMMLERTGNYIGTAIAGVINLLNVDRIVVGGAIMEAEHLVLDSIKRRAREISFSPSFESTRIVEGTLGENAVKN